jgi:hypothetical protein
MCMGASRRGHDNIWAFARMNGRLPTRRDRLNMLRLIRMAARTHRLEASVIANLQLLCERLSLLVANVNKDEVERLGKLLEEGR